MKSSNKILINTAPLFVFYLFLFLILGRILFPNGDEADWDRRVIWYYDFLNLFDFLNFFINDINLDRRCFGEDFNGGIIHSQLFNSQNESLKYFTSFHTSINRVLCFDNFTHITQRLIITFIILLPLLFIIVYRNLFFKFLKLLQFKFNDTLLNNKIEIACYSLLFPTFIYHIGLFSHEQIAYSLLIIAFILFEIKILTLLVASIIFFIDNGTGIFLFLLTIFHSVNNIFIRKINLKIILFLYLIIIVIFDYYNQFLISFFLNLFSDFNLPIIGQKIHNTKVEYGYANTLGYVDKYPLLLRVPQIFIGLFFTTPSFVKSIPLYFLILIFVILSLLKIYKNFNKLKINQNFFNDYTSLISLLVLTMFIITLFPTHANGRYFLIIIPQYLLVTSYVYKFKNIFNFSILTSFILFFSLFIFSIS